jgi:hypothetical protein
VCVYGCVCVCVCVFDGGGAENKNLQERKLLADYYSRRMLMTGVLIGVLCCVVWCDMENRTVCSGPAMR